MCHGCVLSLNETDNLSNGEMVDGYPITRRWGGAWYKITECVSVQVWIGRQWRQALPQIQLVWYIDVVSNLIMYGLVLLSCTHEHGKSTWRDGVKTRAGCCKDWRPLEGARDQRVCSACLPLTIPAIKCLTIMCSYKTNESQSCVCLFWF